MSLNSSHLSQPIKASDYPEKCKKALYISTFFLPFFHLLPTNFDIYELIVLLIFSYLVIKNHPIVLPDRRVTIALVLVLTGYVLSIIGSTNSIEALKFPLQFAFIVFIQVPVMYTLIESRRDIYKHAISLIFSLSIIIFYAMFYFLINGFPSLESRISLFYPNPNLFSNYLFLLSSLTIFTTYYLQKRSGSQTGNNYIILLGLVLVLCGLILIFLAFSRRAFVAIVVTYIIILGTSFGRQNKITDNMYKTVLSIFVLFLFGLIAFISGLYEKFIPERLLDRLNIFEGRGNIRVRTISFIIAGRFLFDNLLIGAGYNNYRDVVSADFGKYVFSDLEAQFFYTPHNMFIIPFVEGGLLAGVGIVILFSIFCSRLFYIWRQGVHTDSVIGFGFGISTLGYIISQQFGFLSVTRLFWFFVIISLIYFRMELKTAN